MSWHVCASLSKVRTISLYTAYIYRYIYAYIRPRGSMFSGFLLGKTLRKYLSQLLTWTLSWSDFGGQGPKVPSGGPIKYIYIHFKSDRKFLCLSKLTWMSGSEQTTNDQVTHLLGIWTGTESTHKESGLKCFTCLCRASGSCSTVLYSLTYCLCSFSRWLIPPFCWSYLF